MCVVDHKNFESVESYEYLGSWESRHQSVLRVSSSSALRVSPPECLKTLVVISWVKMNKYIIISWNIAYLVTIKESKRQFRVLKQLNQLQKIPWDLDNYEKGYETVKHFEIWFLVS